MVYPRNRSHFTTSKNIKLTKTLTLSLNSNFQNCHGRKYGPKGYGFGGGAGCMSMDSGEQFKNTEA